MFYVRGDSNVLYFLPSFPVLPTWALHIPRKREREREREKEAVSKHFLEYCLLKKNDLIFAVFVTKKSDFTEQIFAIS